MKIPQMFLHGVNVKKLLNNPTYLLDTPRRAFYESLEGKPGKEWETLQAIGNEWNKEHNNEINCLNKIPFSWPAIAYLSTKQRISTCDHYLVVTDSDGNESGRIISSFVFTWPNENYNLCDPQHFEGMFKMMADLYPRDPENLGSLASNFETQLFFFQLNDTPDQLKKLLMEKVSATEYSEWGKEIPVHTSSMNYLRSYGLKMSLNLNGNKWHGSYENSEGEHEVLTVNKFYKDVVKIVDVSNSKEWKSFVERAKENEKRTEIEASQTLEKALAETQ